MMRSKLTLGFSFLLLFVVLALPKVVNHSEAEDAYAYALQVENEGYREILHPDHRLYHVLAKAVFELSGAERSFDVLVGLSLVSALAALVGFYFLLRKLGVADPWLAFAYTAGLGLSYGFWRYAHEVESYALGSLVLVLVLGAVFSMKNGWRGFWMAVLVVLALNVHRALGPPLAVMVVVFLLARRDWRQSGVFMVTAVALYFAAEKSASAIAVARPLEKHGISEIFIDENAARQVEVVRGNALGLSSFPKAAVGLGSAELGVNLVMGIDPVYDFLQNKLFPTRFLGEERMMAEGWPMWQMWAWGAGLVLLLSVGLVLLWKSGMGIFRPAEWTPERLAILVGAGAYGGMIVIFEPGNPEMWLLGLPLFWALGAFLTQNADLLRVGTFVALIALTSWLGGMSLLGDAARDYHRVTSKYVLENARAGDLYLMATGMSVQDRFVRYYVGVEPVFVPDESQHWEAFFSEVSLQLEKGRRVFVHGTVAEREDGFGIDLAEFGLEYRGDIGHQAGGELILSAR